MFWETKKIVSRNMEKSAKCSDILHTGFIPVILNIRNPALCHSHSLSQLRLIQFQFLPEQSDFLPQSHFHRHHRGYFIIDSNFLFTFRQ